MRENGGERVQVSTIIDGETFEVLRLCAFEEKMSISAYLRALVKKDTLKKSNKKEKNEKN